MKIKFNFDILICILIVFITKNIGNYAIFMFFILIHEIAHLLVGLLLGIKPKNINVYAFGLSLEFYSFGRVKYKNYKKLLIALAGPLMNLILAIIFIMLKQSQYTEIIYTNIVLAVFNLLPIYPLDGGRIIKSLLAIKLGEKTSKIVTNKLSYIVITIITACYSILILYIHNLAIFVVIIYLWLIIFRENKRLKMNLKMYEALEKFQNG